MADTELSNKLNSALRYGATTAGTAFAMMAMVSLLSPDQVVQLKADIETLKTSILTGYGALVNMWIILGPVAIAVAAKLGWNSSSVSGMAKKLFKIATNPEGGTSSTAAKVEIVNAAASPAVGSRAVINPELASNPATAANVIAHPADIPHT